MSMILQTNTDRYYGKTIARIEDEYGNELQSLTTQDSIVFVFTDGEKVILKPDCRGDDCYISQRCDAKTFGDL